MELFKTIELDKNNDFETKLYIIKNFVIEYYAKSNYPKVQIDWFNTHNETVYSYAMSLTQGERLTQKRLEELQLAAWLHDVAKCEDGDSFEVFINHGFRGAQVARRKLKELGFNHETIDNVANAIERHMGPIPGFMANAVVNWEAVSGNKIILPRPQTIVDKLLYDADMLSLMDRKGIEKILTVRKNDKLTQAKDNQVAKENGISVEEASWRSALQSVNEANESLFTETGKEKGKALLEMAKYLKR